MLTIAITAITGLTDKKKCPSDKVSRRVASLERKKWNITTLITAESGHIVYSADGRATCAGVFPSVIKLITGSVGYVEYWATASGETQV